MSTRTITVEHGGKTYGGQLARIDSTALGYEDHGILTAWLHCSWTGGGISVGGFCLDEPKDREGRDYSRKGTAYGLDHLIRIMETVGVDRWERLPGQQVIVLFEGQSSLGSQSVGISSVLSDDVLVLKAHAEDWLAAGAAS